MKIIPDQGSREKLANLLEECEKYNGDWSDYDNLKKDIEDAQAEDFYYETKGTKYVKTSSS